MRLADKCTHAWGSGTLLHATRWFVLWHASKLCFIFTFLIYTKNRPEVEERECEKQFDEHKTARTKSANKLLRFCNQIWKFHSSDHNEHHKDVPFLSIYISIWNTVTKIWSHFLILHYTKNLIPFFSLLRGFVRIWSSIKVAQESRTYRKGWSKGNRAQEGGVPLWSPLLVFPCILSELSLLSDWNGPNEHIC